MTYPVRIRPEAESEILKAQALYSAIDKQLGLDVRASIVECIERISLQPELYTAT